jgi:hypothetical protein
VRTLVRPGSEGKIPAGAIPVPGDALRAEKNPPEGVRIVVVPDIRRRHT